VSPAEETTVSFTLRLAIGEDVIVTAERVGERTIQATPLAISAVSDTEIERLGITTVDQAPRSRHRSPLPRIPTSVSSAFAALARMPSSPEPIRAQ
jgi:hypothetical protein